MRARRSTIGQARAHGLAKRALRAEQAHAGHTPEARRYTSRKIFHAAEKASLVPTGQILIYRKQKDLPSWLLALCHPTDLAWHSAPAPWCKAGGKVARASRRPRYDKRKAPGWLSRAPAAEFVSKMR